MLLDRHSGSEVLNLDGQTGHRVYCNDGEICLVHGENTTGNLQVDINFGDIMIAGAGGIADIVHNHRLVIRDAGVVQSMFNDGEIDSDVAKLYQNIGGVITANCVDVKSNRIRREVELHEELHEEFRAGVVIAKKLNYAGQEITDEWLSSTPRFEGLGYMPSNIQSALNTIDNKSRVRAFQITPTISRWIIASLPVPQKAKKSFTLSSDCWVICGEISDPGFLELQLVQRESDGRLRMIALS